LIDAMHWSYYILLGSALLAAHFGGPVAGTRALKHRWPYFTANAVLVAAIGIPYLVGLTVLVLEFPVSSGTPWLGFAIMPILLYARLRMKRVLHPELKFGKEPPVDR
jgi:hypothetical protein